MVESPEGELRWHWLTYGPPQVWLEPVAKTAVRVLVGAQRFQSTHRFAPSKERREDVAFEYTCVPPDEIRGSAEVYVRIHSVTPRTIIGDSCALPLSHVQVAWELLPHRYQPLAERYHLIWYDSRGSGLSDREAIDFSMDAMVRDVVAVVESAGLTGFAMAATYGAVPIAVTYGAIHPEKISSLVLADGAVKPSDWNQNPVSVAEETLRSGDWTLYTETLARVLIGIENQELASRFAVYIRECVEPEALRAAFSSTANEDWDVSALLARVSAHTLVVHNRNHRYLPVQVGQRLAARIPNARFQLVDDMDYLQLAGIITAFVSESGQIAQRQADLPSGMTAILFADIADSTALTERLGDATFREKARELDGALRTIIRERAGTPVEGKLLGDGVLAVFTSARQAIEAAVACGAAGSDAGLPLHLGLHAGDVIREENNVYGGAVNIASRISGLSAPGEVLVSETVRSLARTSAGVRFEDRGERARRSSPPHDGYLHRAATAR